MAAAAVLSGVPMADDGVTRVVSRRLPREGEEGSGSGEGPPPFAGIAEEEEDERFSAPAPDSAGRPDGKAEAA
jgi:hypothetical protein